ncbi:Rpn family recombination-promoting nuclease/putative transposase [Paenibacillus sp. MZ04-78.2]|uniref:Rpn family recombination-promoting nuclease/putative transposase n=1 Tax=Paenibacillus sp. MZ04-78.2 TaxID=2962034 RepID=UPI002815C436|nr:Rpn family recombination-promoting nuclease/putative transposase [Paenibacillus sp. MZ04-78.2]
MFNYKSNWEVLTMNEPVLKKAMDTLEFLSQDAEARRLYEDRQKFLHDEASMIERALAEGEARGERKKALEMAKELLAHGVEISIIAKASGLPESEILALKERN